MGDHAVKLHGRTYHFLPTTEGLGGLSYFTFDALNAAILHGESINGEHYRVNSDYIESLYNFMKVENIFAKECQLIGRQVQDLTLNVNITTSVFDVAAVTSLHTAGDRILRYIVCMFLLYGTSSMVI